jgi:hypothetical protein
LWTAINMHVQVALLYAGLHSFGYMPRSGIAGSYGRSVFSFLRTLHTAFHSVCRNLHCHQEYVSIPFLLHPCQHLFFVLLIIAILTGLRWYLSVFFICVSFMSKDIERFFIYHLYFFWECLLNSFAHLFSGLSILCKVSVLSSLYIQIINPLSDV